MENPPVRVKRTPKAITLVLDRGSEGNTINSALIEGIERALDDAEADPGIRLVVLEGQPGVFCTGMDFRSAASSEATNPEELERAVRRYFQLLKRFTRSGKVVVAKVDGKVNAGGLGLVAATDFVIATERSTFALSEALFGLLPATVVPFLMRRIGFQKAYVMTLTAQANDARAAVEMGLVDEVADHLDEAIRKLLVRVDRVREKTIRAAKEYFERMWFFTREMENEAVRWSVELIRDPETFQSIREFIQEGVLPWANR